MRMIEDFKDLGARDFVLLWLGVGVFTALWVLMWPFRKFFPLTHSGPKLEKQR